MRCKEYTQVIKEPTQNGSKQETVLSTNKSYISSFLPSLLTVSIERISIF